MRFIFRVFLIVIVTAVCSKGEQQFLFEHLSLADGLSQSTINSICQDRIGFLWFATSNGLNKYDGYSFTVYHHNPSNNSSLSNDITNCIIEDKKGNLWIGTEDGVNLFNRFSESFTRFSLNDGTNNAYNGRSIMGLVEDKNGYIYAGSMGGGLFIYNPKNNQFSRLALKGASFNYITKLFLDNHGMIWMATYSGLVKYNPDSKELSYYSIGKELDTKYSISCVISKNDSELYIGTMGSGLWLFNIKEGKFSSPFCGKGIPAEICSRRITSLFIDSSKNLWISTMGAGVLLYDQQKNSFTSIKNNPSVQNSLVDDNINIIAQDRSGIMWFGTSYMGLNKLSMFKAKFVHYKKEPSSSNSILSNSIYCLLKDKKGVVWIGSPEGVTSLDRKTGKVKYYTSKTVPAIANDWPTKIYEDNQENLWIGTRTGLTRLDKNRRLVKTYHKDTLNANSLKSDMITAIYQDKENYLWVAGAASILQRLDLSTGKFTNYFPIKIQGRVFGLYEDKEGYFWIGTQKGLVKFDRRTNKSTLYIRNENDPNSLSNNLVFTIYEDKDGYIWVGTYGGGLNKLDVKSGKFTCFSEEQGLPNNVVYGILPDDEGNIWLSTNKGICRFNLKTYGVRTYDVTEGLQSYEYNSGAYYRSPDGEMFFGGLNGFNSFYPSMIKDNKNKPSVAITSINVLNEKYDPSLPKLELSYDKNFISFEFVSLDYVNPRNNKYKYKLEGFDKDYITAGSRRFASYTNLEPGEYRFHVIGSNNDDVWNNAGANILIIIKPPFWKTWWFYLISLLFGIALIYSVHRYRVRLKIDRIMALEQMRKRLADDFHDELGHKLTKISLYSEIMKRELDGKLNGTTEYLNKISNTANSLYDDTKDFIWSIDPGKDTLYDLAVYLKDFGDELFDRTGIAFRVNEISLHLQKILLPMDWKRQLILLFKEAMNNALRHSQCKTVELQVCLYEHSFNIELKDDGSGISADKEAKGRGIGNMHTRAKKIGGELLIDTGNKGTLIKFSRSLLITESKT